MTLLFKIIGFIAVFLLLLDLLTSKSLKDFYKEYLDYAHDKFKKK